MASVFSQHCFTGNFVKLRCISCSIGFLSFLLLHFVSEPESLCLFSVYSFLSSTHFSSLLSSLLLSSSMPPFSQQLHLSTSLRVFRSPLCARLHELYAGVRGPALPGLWGAADQLFITAKQILASRSRALAGGLKKTQRETEERIIFHQSVSQSQVLPKRVYTLSPEHAHNLRKTFVHLYRF